MVDHGLDERDSDALRRLEFEHRSKRRRGPGRVVDDVTAVGARIENDKPMGLRATGFFGDIDLHDSRCHLVVFQIAGVRASLPVH